MSEIHRAGYVAIIGKPNAGKSTLLNTILGQKLTITTPKPQTTRKRILGILSEENYQIIFLDTPGIIDPKYLLQEKMMKYVKHSVFDADIIIHIIDSTSQKEIDDALSGEFERLYLGGKKKPSILLMNKIDLIDEEAVKAVVAQVGKSRHYLAGLAISALDGSFRPAIIDLLLAHIPEGPKFYPDDFVSDENERFFVTEIIREKILELYREEVPYSCEVVIEDYKEREEGKYFIAALIYVERDSQKSIVIGKGGIQIKKLGELARKDIEIFIEHPVYLELRVKVKDSWRSNERALNEFGYDDGNDE